jgi:hypothetical protein
LGGFPLPVKVIAPEGNKCPKQENVDEFVQVGDTEFVDIGQGGTRQAEQYLDEHGPYQRHQDIAKQFFNQIEFLLKINKKGPLCGGPFVIVNYFL